MPTAPSSRSARSRWSSVASRRVRSRTRRARRAPACSASPARPGGRARSLRASRSSRRRRSTARARARAAQASAASSVAGDVAGLHRDHDDVGVGDRPGRARHHSHLGEPLLEVATAVGVDLGHGDRSASQPASSRPPTSAAPIFPPPSTRRRDDIGQRVMPGANAASGPRTTRAIGTSSDAIEPEERFPDRSALPRTERPVLHLGPDGSRTVARRPGALQDNTSDILT